MEQTASPFYNCNPANPQIQIVNCGLPAQKRLEPLKQIQPALKCKFHTRDTGSSCPVQSIAPRQGRDRPLQDPGCQHEPEIEPRVEIGCGLDVAGEVDVDVGVDGDASVDGDMTRSCIQPQS